MKILILTNLGMGLYKFRRELLETLVAQNHDIYLSLPLDEFADKLEAIGCHLMDTPIDRRGTNPIRDLNLFLTYIKIIKEVQPDIALTYTIKPNIYGGLACQFRGIPYLTNVTGLGTSIQNQGVLQKISFSLYRLGLRKSSHVFFQNTANRDFFLNKKIVNPAITEVIPGSGVNLDQFKLADYPPVKDGIRFLFIGRIMKDKGISDLLAAAIKVKQRCPATIIDVVGPCEEDYESALQDAVQDGLIRYHGLQKDVRSFIRRAHATILPSYHEGTSNVLLESAAMGRPVLASAIPGCQETFDQDVSGLGFKPKDVESLAQAMLQFIELPAEKKRAMGQKGRQKMEREYDRNIVISRYLHAIQNTVRV